jgi:ABC-type multidrug transport system permease subunit
MMYIFVMMTGMCGSGLGFMIGALSNSVTETSALATGFVMPILAFTGLIANNSTLPWWFGWIQYLSPTRYTFEGICIA